jgi:hypothetical protein
MNRHSSSQKGNNNPAAKRYRHFLPFTKSACPENEIIP